MAYSRANDSIRQRHDDRRRERETHRNAAAPLNRRLISINNVDRAIVHRRPYYESPVKLSGRRHQSRSATEAI